MLKLSPRLVALLAATATVGASGAAIAGAASSGTTGAAGTAAAQRPNGDCGPGRHADTTAIAKALGVSDAQLKSALDAVRPVKPTGRKDPGAQDAATIAKALGASTDDVRSVLDSVRRPGKPDGRKPGRGGPADPGRGGDLGPGGAGPRGGGRDDTALVTALVKQLSVSQDRAQAAVDAVRKAHDTEHQAHDTAMDAAVAKALGKDTAAVQKAFEASRPAAPPMP